MNLALLIIFLRQVSTEQWSNAVETIKTAVFYMVGEIVHIGNHAFSVVETQTEITITEVNKSKFPKGLDVAALLIAFGPHSDGIEMPAKFREVLDVAKARMLEGPPTEKSLLDVEQPPEKTVEPGPKADEATPVLQAVVPPAEPTLVPSPVKTPRKKQKAEAEKIDSGPQTTAEIIAKLQEDFPEELVRFHGDGTPFTTWTNAEEYMQSICPQFSTEVKSSGFYPDGKRAFVFLKGTIKGSDGEVSHENVGECDVDSPYGALKAARSNACTRVLVDFGVGRQFYKTIAECEATTIALKTGGNQTEVPASEVDYRKPKPQNLTAPESQPTVSPTPQDVTKPQIPTVKNGFGNLFQMGKFGTSSK